VRPPKNEQTRPHARTGAAAIEIALPPIKETEWRGARRTSYSFLGPDEHTVFAFDSFKEARTARESLRPAYEQSAIFENVKRQAGRPGEAGD
jgi:hypothetical protein